VQVSTACTAVFSAGDERSLALLRQQLLTAVAASGHSPHLTSNAFDSKTEAASAHMYFHYYGMLQHQQNMLQDSTRTGTYFWAIMGNRGDFEGATVVDVGAGSGILSLFAAQVHLSHH
jgi:2-polyprenyl-3-methyl-5-hydroxy-6-metoxy-1,4-benzoquinol methylase